VALRDAQGLTILLLANFTGDVDPLNVTLRQHTAGVGGTSANLVAIDRYWIKTEATLDGDEQWAEVTQAASHQLAAFGTPEEQKLVAIELDGTELADGFTHVSLDVPDQGAGVGTKVTSVLYVLHGLGISRKPQLLRAPQ
jgi:hypothetical protein